MTVLITGGTFGYFNGRKVVPITRADGPQTFDAQLERRLVEEDGIAVYFDTDDARVPASSSDDAEGDGIISEADADDIEEGEVDLERLSVSELKEMAREAGIKPIPKTKTELIAALEDSPDLDVAEIE